MLHGIDISSWQGGIVPSRTPSNFVIVKVTGGTAYYNPFWKDMADDVLASGKKLGLYHYAWESWCHGTAKEEADFFLDTVRGYDGKFIPVLDWENEALSLPATWARDWMDRVAEFTGARPWFYGYASNVNSTDYGCIASRPLWMASYLDRYSGGGFVDNPAQIWATGDWPKLTAYQYTSTGRIPGYGGNLDLSVFYGGNAEWDEFCGKKVEQKPGKARNNAGLKYHVHVQKLADLPTVHDGQVAGTTGASLRMEAITFDAIPAGWEIELRLHIQDLGWKTYKAEVGKLCGTKALGKRIEKVIIDVKKKPDGDKRKLYFRVHEQNKGWKAETPEGYASGTDGLYRRLEAIQIWLA